MTASKKMISKSNDADPYGSGSESYLYMFLMFSKINIFLMAFSYQTQHLMTLKIKDQKLFGRNCILDNFI